MKRIVDLLHKDLSYKIQGIAFEIRKDFGLGHKEQIYQKAFEEELERNCISYKREKAIKIFSPKNGKFIGLYRPDFIIDNKIILEIKTYKFVPKDEMRKIYDYLRNSEYELGYLVNFASPRLYTKRIIFTNNKKNWLGNSPLNNTNHKLTNTKSNFLVLFSILLVFVSGLFSGLCIAQQQEIKLLISPEMFEWQVKRGEKFSEKMIIYNRSEVPVPIEATVTNFGAQEESGTITFFEEPAKRVGEEDDISFNPRKWIKIENPNFILDPKEMAEVKLRVEIPENAEPGGHYAVVLFEPKLPSFYFEKEAVRAIPKIGVLVLFSVEVEGVKKVEKPLIISEFIIPEKFRLQKLEDLLANISGLFQKAQAENRALFSIVEKSELPFSLGIKNEDIFHIKPEGKLSIINSWGKIVGETEIKKTTVLPGKTRKFPVEFKPNLPKNLVKYLPAWVSSFISQNLLFGKYKALLSLKIEDDIVNKEIEFWIFPWKVVLPFSFFTLLILFLIIKYRKRIKSAFLVLFKKSV
jgi:GxxExxY protein